MADKKSKEVPSAGIGYLTFGLDKNTRKFSWIIKNLSPAEIKAIIVDFLPRVDAAIIEAEREKIRGEISAEKKEG